MTAGMLSSTPTAVIARSAQRDEAISVTRVDVAFWRNEPGRVDQEGTAVAVRLRQPPSSEGGLRRLAKAGGRTNPRSSPAGQGRERLPAVIAARRHACIHGMNGTSRICAA